MKPEKLSTLDLPESAEELLASLKHAREVSIEDEYKAWRDRFTLSRMKLGLRIALATFFTFSLLNLSNFVFNRPQFNGALLLAQIAVQFVLLIGLLLLPTPFLHNRPSAVFLGLAWSTTLIPQLKATLIGIAQPDIIGWSLTFFGLATLSPVRWRLHLVAQLGVFAYYFGVNGLLGLKVPPAYQPVEPSMLTLYFFWVCVFCELSASLYERLAKAELKARRTLEAERERSERLLLNILPQPIAQRLKEQPQTIADSFAEVSVLFADIVGFTELSARISPTELVKLLNEIFSLFDHLVEDHELEKIKTIGDAYMVVAGLPEHRSDHAEAIAEMALDMQKTLARFNSKYDQNFRIRIGISTGLVVAGVIGFKKFAYDLWGDTVNTASRMESHGLPNRIQVSESTYNRLKDKYLFEERGEISIKGKGTMKAYLLQGKI